MVNQDNTKIGVGAIAVAGSLLAAYMLYKQWRKRKDGEEDQNGDSVGSGLTDVRRRPGSRGRNGRNGRHVSDPGRMFYSTDRVMPVPSETAKEGIYKRHSSGAKISHIPKPVSPQASDAKKDSPSSEASAGSVLPGPDVIPSSAKQSLRGPADERYEDAVEKKVRKKTPEVSAGQLSVSKETEKSHIQKIPVKTPPAKEPVQKAPVVKAEQSLQESALPKSTGEAQGESRPAESLAKSTDGANNEGGAGEAMAAPFDPQLLDDQSTILIGDSEGSDVGAGDTLAEEDQFTSKGGITLSPSSSEASSPAKSPLRTADVTKQETTVSSTTDKSGIPKPPSQPTSREMDTSKPEESEPESGELNLDPETITKAILLVQKSPNNLDKKVIKILVDLLKVKEEKLLQTALESIVRCAAFSANQKVLRENRCPEELCRLLKLHSVSALGGTVSSDNILVSVNNAIMNLSMDVANQAKLQACIPILIDLVTHEGLSSNVKLSSLQPLTNLSTTSSYHGQYTRAIQQLYDLLDTGNRVVRIQALKLLVNLSCNSDMVKHLLAAKAPTCMMSLLEKTADPHLSLRLVTLLANISTTVQKEEVTFSSLPPDEKAASPETMYSAIFSVNNLTQVRSKVYPLTRHDSEDMSQQASRLYNSLPNC